jgi:transcriptional regulator with XRE-family HTH domain
MLTSEEIRRILGHLGLTQAEAAQLLGVTPRTVRRWLEGDELPGPAEQALRAWLRLAEMRMPWRPDSEAIADGDEKQIAAHCLHAIDLSDLLGRVEARGGPKVSWDVDWAGSTAVLGPMEVSFYKLRNGGFSLSTYRRKDKDPDVRRDRELIEDAAYCIAQAIKENSHMDKTKPEFGPVKLVYHDGPIVRPPSGLGRLSMLHIEEFPSVKVALQRAAELKAASKLYMPRIDDAGTGEPIFSMIETLEALSGP